MALFWAGRNKLSDLQQSLLTSLILWFCENWSAVPVIVHFRNIMQTRLKKTWVPLPSSVFLHCSGRPYTLKHLCVPSYDTKDMLTCVISILKIKKKKQTHIIFFLAIQSSCNINHCQMKNSTKQWSQVIGASDQGRYTHKEDSIDVVSLL